MTGHFRFSFDIPELGDGIGIVPVAVGLFGLGEILSTPEPRRDQRVTRPKLRELLPTRERMAAVGGADRARLGARLPDRHHPGLRAHHFELHVLCAGAADLEDAGGIRQGRGGRRRRPGIGQQRRLDRRLRADAGARHADRAGHRGADGGAADPRHSARADAGQRSSQRVLGLRRLDVCRQPDAAGAQPAAGRPVREHAAHSLRLSLSADHHVLHHRRLRGEQLDRRRLDHADHGRGRLCAEASSTSIRRRWCSAS